MSSEILNKTLDKSAKIGFCISVGAYSMLGVMAPEATASQAVPKQADTHHLFTAEGKIQCEDGVPVTGVWVESIPDSGWANLGRIGQSTVFWYTKATSDPLYTVHVGCGGTPNKWAETDYSHLVTVGESNDFLCYAKQNPDNIEPDRCVLDPALGSFSLTQA